MGTVFRYNYPLETVRYSMRRFLHFLLCALTLAAALVSVQSQTLDFWPVSRGRVRF